MDNITSHPESSEFQSLLIARFAENAFSFSGNNVLYINSRYYTYQDLWDLTIYIYDQIPKQENHTKIGIYCGDDVYTYASILAIQLYGASYVPLNSKYPTIKNREIIKECELPLLLTSTKNNDIIAFEDLCKISFIEPIEKPPIIEIVIELSSFVRVKQPIAYILFTSGSTGKPKGVPVSHQNVNHFFKFFLDNYDFKETDRFLQVYELTFDVSVFSFFMPLLKGACCFVLPNEGIKFIKTIEFLINHKITVVSMVPTILNYIKNYLPQITLPDLRYSFFSGDALYHNLAVEWNKSIPKGEIHNFYGPTETTIVCSRYIFDINLSAQESINNIVPLGKPFKGMEYLIIDENHTPTIKGELCFSGTQVIAGYLNNKHNDCFFMYNNKRYYKTGDVASVNSSGNLVFHGRKDTQVKINGYRIELAEIENSVSELVKQKCVVVTKKTKAGNDELIAFIEKTNFNSNQIKEKLLINLPAFMIPHEFIYVENFELNMNGKIDKHKLVDRYIN